MADLCVGLTEGLIRKNNRTKGLIQERIMKEKQE